MFLIHLLYICRNNNNNLVFLFLLMFERLVYLLIFAFSFYNFRCFHRYFVKLSPFKPFFLNICFFGIFHFEFSKSNFHTFVKFEALFNCLLQVFCVVLLLRAQITNICIFMYIFYILLLYVFSCYTYIFTEIINYTW